MATFLYCVLFLFFKFQVQPSSCSFCVNLKRHFEEDEVETENVIGTRAGSSNKNSRYSDEPDLFKSLKDPRNLLTFPEELQDFIRIFGSAWSAHEFDLEVQQGNEDFELLKWSNSPVVEAVDFKTHCSFINQILEVEDVYLNETGSPIWDLVTEYIVYTFNRPDRQELTGQEYLELLINGINSENIQVFQEILKYSPSSNFSEELVQVWRTLIQKAINDDLSFSKSCEMSQDWLETFYLLCKTFGPMPLEELAKMKEFYREATEKLSSVLMIQPIISKISQHQQAAQFQGQKPIILYFWIDKFLKFDELLKYPTPENQEILANFADSLYTNIRSIEGNNLLSKFIIECLQVSAYRLLQFILLYSSTVRSLIPGKPEACSMFHLILSKCRSELKFEDVLTFIIGFDLKFSDFVEHLAEKINFKSELMKKLRFIMLVAESFPTTGHWQIPAHIEQFITFEDSKRTFLLEAGKIILARHFGILSVFTNSTGQVKEEACFRDLAWFINFYLAKYRPDLEYDVRIK